jgi:hypothetical protein
MVTGHTPGEGAALTFTLKAEPTQREGIEAPPKEVLVSIRGNERYINEQMSAKIVLPGEKRQQKVVTERNGGRGLTSPAFRLAIRSRRSLRRRDSVHLEMACLQALLEGESTTKRTFLETCRLQKISQERHNPGRRYIQRRLLAVDSGAGFGCEWRRD